MFIAVDTATRLLGIALHNGYDLLAEQSWYTRNSHNIELAAAVEKMLTQAQVAPPDVTGIAISQGPGSFTGLRIGMAFAKSMAFALQVPLIPVPTFDVVAYATPYFKGSLYAVVQAGRGRIHGQRYRWKKGGWETAEPAFNTSWPEFIESLDKSALISGEIDQQGFAALEANVDKAIEVASGSQRLRRAGYLAELAYARQSDLTTTDPALVTPIYLKKP